MGFLVGNDFIPHLPHLHINHDALPLLYGTYIAILPELGGKTTLLVIECPPFIRVLHVWLY
jgi:5'-3' exonuclease